MESVADLPEGAIADGDNAFRADDLEGTVLVIREVKEVDRLMREGVPEGTIGVIDDAGGTMTAPILEEFEGVLCLAGTVRSHLAIISREFGVPVLMDVRMARTLKTGERVRVQYSAEAAERRRLLRRRGQAARRGDAARGVLMSEWRIDEEQAARRSTRSCSASTT